MKSKLFLCAEEIILNAYTNSISAINIFENIDTNRFPLTIPKIMWLHVLERTTEEPSTKELYLVLYIDQTEIYRMTVGIDFKLDLLAKNIAVVTNLSIPKAGNFRAVFRDGKDVLAICEFQISHKP